MSWQNNNNNLKVESMIFLFHFYFILYDFTFFLILESVFMQPPPPSLLGFDMFDCCCSSCTCTWRHRESLWPQRREAPWMRKLSSTHHPCVIGIVDCYCSIITDINKLYWYSIFFPCFLNIFRYLWNHHIILPLPTSLATGFDPLCSYLAIVQCI